MTDSFIVVAAAAEEIAEEHPVVAGRVSSARLLKADGVRLMHLALDSGEALAEHTAAAPITVQCLEGRFRFEAEGREVDLAPGGIVYVAARVPHAVHALEAGRLLLSLHG
ncbi:cupin domain-containing protein [Agromyces lapidis]|uniref:Cupin domain-containing protein n=1 Tax=Agromyces lapidis TaxID=279574 RepID=A0ABV5SV53_9MICO|nr:cupin domain-containing protein [Agromyces lapidis]